MKIVFFGTPDFVIPVLTTLIGHYDVVGVVTAPDTMQGRKKVLTPSPVKQYAVDNDIAAIFTLQQFNGAMEQLQALNPDLFVVAAYGKIIPGEILAIPRFGALNIHPSLLPKYRGPSPIQSVLLQGEKETGVSLIKMDEKMDHGPLLVQETVPLSPDDTFATLHVSLFQKATEMLIPTIEGYVNGTIVPEPQNDEDATYCKRITKEDGYFAIENPPAPEILDRMIRAYYPWPTAWTRVRIKNQEVRIMKLLPGDFVQLEGKKPVKVKELLNGYPEMKETLDKLFRSKGETIQ